MGPQRNHKAHARGIAGIAGIAGVAGIAADASMWDACAMHLIDPTPLLHTLLT